MGEAFLFASVVAVVLGVVTVTLIGWRGFDSWLSLRERERLSTIDKAAFSKKLEELDDWKSRVNQFMINNGPRR